MDDDPVAIIAEMVKAQAAEFDAIAEWASAWWIVNHTERGQRAFAIATANRATFNLIATGKKAAVWEALYEDLS